MPEATIAAIWDHPRIRGEHRRCGGIVIRRLGSSPHTRGAQDHVHPRPVDVGIIPAYAGSTATSPGPGCRGTDHPRIRGEHDLYHSQAQHRRGSSPHTRGARRRRRCGGSARRIIPAYAGSTRCIGVFLSLCWDHPRIRGEHDFGCGLAVIVVGSSPHTRGAPSAAASSRHRSGIIPAYAGSTPIPDPAPSTLRDHPRIRGEHRMQVFTSRGVQGSSPHTRGARGWLRRRPCVVRDHPRIRGEHGAIRQSLETGPGSSPHTRGALPRRALILET